VGACGGERMKKDKKIAGKKINFDPKNYDYMDTLTREGWIWEFIKRSQQFEDFCKKCEKSIQMSERYNEDLEREYMNNFYPFFMGRSDTGNPTIDRTTATKLNPVIVVNMKWKVGMSKIIFMEKWGQIFILD
jgi:hypothetical protein